MAYRKPTSSAIWLRAESARLKAHAKESLTAWCMLGQSAKYGETLARAANIDRAAEITSVSARREYLRNNGIEA